MRDYTPPESWLGMMVKWWPNGDTNSTPTLGWVVSRWADGKINVAVLQNIHNRAPYMEVKQCPYHKDHPDAGVPERSSRGGQGVWDYSDDAIMAIRLRHGNVMPSEAGSLAKTQAELEELRGIVTEIGGSVVKLQEEVGG